MQNLKRDPIPSLRELRGKDPEGQAPLAYGARRERESKSLFSKLNPKTPLFSKGGLGGFFKITLTSLIAALACTGIIYAATTVGTNIFTGGTLTVTGANTFYGVTSIGGALTATSTLDVTGQATFSSNVGIGTSSPYAALSVVGEAVASYFTATSTTATSTFANGIYITGGCFRGADGNCISGGGSGTPGGSDTQIQYNNGGSSFGGASGFVWDDSNLRVGIGTTSPYAKLSVVGEIVGSYFTATSTTATSTFAGWLKVGTGTPDVAQTGGSGYFTTTLEVGTTSQLSGSVTLGNNDTDDPKIIFDGITGDGKLEWDESDQSFLFLDDNDVTILEIDTDESYGYVGFGNEDALGKLELIAGTISARFGTPTATIIDGQHASAGIFISEATNAFSHRAVTCAGERNDASLTLTANTHTAADSTTVLTNASATFDTDCNDTDPGGDQADSCIGLAVVNVTDSSWCTITDNDQTSVTCAVALAGGSDNTWDNNDGGADDVAKIYASIVLNQNQGCYGSYLIYNGDYTNINATSAYIKPSGVAGVVFNLEANIPVPAMAGLYGKAYTLADALTTHQSALWAGAGVASGTGTATNNHGLYLEEQIVGTNNYQIYSADSAGAGVFTVSPAGAVAATGLRVTGMTATETIAAGESIEDDACGGLKRITSATEGVVTGTTDTINAPSAANEGCHMTIKNVGNFTIWLDGNANFWNVDGVIPLVPNQSFDVYSSGAGGKWIVGTLDYIPFERILTAAEIINLSTTDLVLLPDPPDTLTGGSWIVYDTYLDYSYVDTVFTGVDSDDEIKLMYQNWGRTIWEIEMQGMLNVAEDKTYIIPNEIINRLPATLLDNGYVQDGGDNQSILTDGSAIFNQDCGGTVGGINACYKFIVYNETDNSWCLINANTETSVTCTLANGTENDWDNNDTAVIQPIENAKSGQSKAVWLRNDGNGIAAGTNSTLKVRIIYDFVQL